MVALAAPVGVALVVVGNAWAGLMPGVGFWDTGEFQAVLPIMGTAHPTGYPTYVLLGFVANLLLTPIGEPAFRITVVSLIAVAVAAAACTALVRRLTGSAAIGIAAGIGLATTPIVWMNATRADPHPIHLAFVALLLLVLVRWEHARREAGPAGADRWLVAAAIVFGLAAGNHSLTLLLIPPIALYVLAVEPAIVRRPGFALGCVAAAAATVSLVYLELPIRAGILRAPLVYARPDTWDGFWYIALAEQFRGSLDNPFADLPDKVDKVVALVNAQLGLLAVAVPVAFLVTAWRLPRLALLTGSAMVITVMFNTSYSNADIERYYLGPALWAWIWLGVAAAEVVRQAVNVGLRVGGVAAGPGTALGPRLAVAVIAAALLLVPSLPDLDARRAHADRSTETAAALWLDEVLPVIPQDAVLVSWWSTSTPLWYAQHVEGRRPDIFIVDDRTMLDLDLGRAPDVIRRYLGARPVYVIRVAGPDTDELTSQFDMTVVASGGSTAVWAVHGPLAATP
jgi:4-amino-4-deoxy-L-arabinose transferase-like glycosyltransferase